VGDEGIGGGTQAEGYRVGPIPKKRENRKKNQDDKKGIKEVQGEE